jgi:hypothetical protein
MPTYRFGDQSVRRKNLYRPCIMGEEFDKAEADGADEEFGRLLKVTAWADNIAVSEWPVVLQEPEAKPYNRSRLKKKAAGWLMALQRIAYLYPELFEEIVEHSQRTYREQVREEPVVEFKWADRLFDPENSWLPVMVGDPVNWHPVADIPQSEEAS